MDEEKIPFCGYVDQGLSLLETANLSWRKRTLVWTIAGSLPGMPANVFQTTITAAFAEWAAHCGLAFRQATNGERPDVVITTGMIDGAGGTLAWSNLPNGQDGQLTQRYDTGDQYVVAEQPPRGKIDLLAVATHEIGHALGLEHAGENSGDIMAPFYKPGLRTLQTGDVARIQRLYGGPAPVPPNPTPPSGEPIIIRIYGADRIEIPGYKVTPT